MAQEKLSNSLRHMTSTYQLLHRKHRHWTQLVTALGCFVVFVTTYALILPAITLDSVVDPNVTYCGLAGHLHDESCYEIVQTLTCELEESEDHTHTEECYEEQQALICQSEEHEHELQCYSNPIADLESYTEWELPFSELTITGDRGADLLAVADTQLGYKESLLNYQVSEDGAINGYTRYGAWYGFPFGRWDAMFVSFCLNYAGVSERYVPYAHDSERWAEQLDKMGALLPMESAAPKAGDLLFFDTDSDGAADHVGIIAEVAEDRLYAIEGDSQKAVMRNAYSLNDETLVGTVSLNELNEYATDANAFTTDDYTGEPTDNAFATDPFTYEAQIYSDETYTESIDTGDVIEVSGRLPSNITVKAYPVEITLDSYSVVCAYDITLFLPTGEAFEPEEALSVSITPSGLLSEDGDTSAPCSGVYYIPEVGEPEEIPSSIEGDSVVFSAEHFSIYAVVTSDVDISFTNNAGGLASLTLALNNPTKEYTYRIEYSDDGGVNWSASSAPTVTMPKNNLPATASVILNNTAELNYSLDRQFRLHGYKGGNHWYSSGVNLAGILETESPGFSDWVNGEFFEGSEPSTAAELLAAYMSYFSIPDVQINYTRDGDGNLTSLTATATPSNPAHEFHWQYHNGTSWLDFDNTVSYSGIQDPTTGAIADALEEGYSVRAVLYSGTIPLASTKSLSAELSVEEKAEIISDINDGLGLDHYLVHTYMVGGSPSEVSDTFDLSIGGTRFTYNFYYTEVAADDNVPFDDADSYADYLVMLYLKNGGGSAGLAAVEEAFERYLYDLYDPNYDLGGKSNVDYGYPNSQNYGDQSLSWPKEDSNYSPFHFYSDALINQLNYNYLEGGVDYTNMLRKIEKSAEPLHVGDLNTDRKYDINIKAPIDSKINGPVAFIFQIQTSWQMFDLNHANALTGDNTNKGAFTDNTEIASLYDIKHAILDFIDYIDAKYPAGNAAVAITNTQHSKTWNMVAASNNLNEPQYVTNDYDSLRKALLGWDIFGDCEHIHYGTDALKNVVLQLQDSLSGWRDENNELITYDGIRKVVIAVGGATENDTGNDGVGCELSWDEFQVSQMNAVYGIRTNSGTPRASNTLGKNHSCPAISWIDAYQNADKYETFGDGGAMFVASSRQDFFDTLLGIMQKEIDLNAHSVNVSGRVWIDDFRLTDTVRKEFHIDFSKQFEIKVTEDGIGEGGGDGETHSIFVDMSDVMPVPDVDGNNVYTKNVHVYLIDTDQSGRITVTEMKDGTTKVELWIAKVFNGENIELNFRVQANEDYIGSNNVLTNLGRPEVSYSHTVADVNKTDFGETTSYSRKSLDEPEVNVPIRFSVTDGETVTILQGSSVECADLAERIVEDAEFRAERYGQINGTLTYEWELPGSGTTSSSVIIRDGKAVGGSLPGYSHTFTGAAAGDFPGTLQVTFTPETADAISGVAVNSRSLEGDVLIRVVAPDSTTTFYVEKQWPLGSNGNTSVDFYLLQNGHPIKDALDQPEVYHLTETGGWQRKFENMPAVIGSTVVEYSVSEINIPSGYSATYSKTTQAEDAYYKRIRLDFTPQKKLDKAFFVYYKIDGVEYCAAFPKGTYPAGTSCMLTLNEGLEDVTHSLSLLGIATSNRPSWSTVPNGDKITLSASSISESSYQDGQITRDVFIIRNSPGAVLPSTGGVGFFYYIFGAFAAIAAGTAIYICAARRNRRERRATP